MTSKAQDDMIKHLQLEERKIIRKLELDHIKKRKLKQENINDRRNQSKIK